MGSVWYSIGLAIFAMGISGWGLYNQRCVDFGPDRCLVRERLLLPFVCVCLVALTHRLLGRHARKSAVKPSAARDFLFLSTAAKLPRPLTVFLKRHASSQDKMPRFLAIASAALAITARARIA